jgi:hypothetical protein
MILNDLLNLYVPLVKYYFLMFSYHTWLLTDCEEKRTSLPKILTETQITLYGVHPFEKQRKKILTGKDRSEASIKKGLIDKVKTFIDKAKQQKKEPSKVVEPWRTPINPSVPDVSGFLALCSPSSTMI